MRFTSSSSADHRALARRPTASSSSLVKALTRYPLKGVAPVSARRHHRDRRVAHRSSAGQAEEVVADISAAGGRAVAVGADVTQADEGADMVYDVERRWGRVDIVVHNALIPFDVTSFAELTWQQLGGKLDREMRAGYVSTKAVVPGMISRNYGRLVCLSTGLSRRPRGGMITLGTAKAALDQFVRYFALELAPHGITANRGVDVRPVASSRRIQPHGSPRAHRRGGRNCGLFGK